MSDHNQAHGGGAFGTIVTLGFYLLSKITLGDAASTMVVITGLTTIGLNVQKFLINNKNKK